MIIPEWFPNKPPIYDIHKSYADNAAYGPFFNEPIPERPPCKPSVDCLGFKLLSPLGVPAGPLLNSRWIALAAKLGFDCVTYKTIRSFAHPGHQLPNMIFIDPVDDRLARAAPPAHAMEDLTLTNSFGMPSKSPDFLLEDITQANRSLMPGQLMIVSVVGTPNQGVSFKEDFVRAAMLAKEAKAKVIEANLSCPNVGKTEGMLYLDPEAVYEFTKAMVHAIRPVPLVLKVGTFPDPNIMTRCFTAAARAGAAAICGINSVSMQVVDAKGEPALGPHRPTSGVCGAAIFHQALDFLQHGSEILRKERLDLELFGCGGIVKSEQFDTMLTHGPKIAMCATGMMWDPLLALRTHWRHAHESTRPHSALV